MLTRVISGGQTGVEQGILSALPDDFAGADVRLISDVSGYCVSTSGRCWRFGKRTTRLTELPQWHLVCPRTRPDGYREIVLNSNGKKRYRYVHRLVLQTFVGPCPPGQEACHNDGDRGNNCLENLRWDLRCNNARDREKHGTVVYGETVGTAILRDRDIEVIRRFLSLGVAHHLVAYGFGISERQIWAISQEKSWTRVRDTRQQTLRRTPRKPLPE